MSRKAKGTSRKNKSSKQLEIQSDLIDYNTWFFCQSRDKKVRPEQKNEIKVFFGEKGLKDTESKSKYDETLKLY